MIEVEHLIKEYAGHRALDDVSLVVPRGSVYGLLGPNGAGKSSLIRIVNRITAPDSGRVLFDGREMQPRDVERIGYLPEERGLYKKMKVGEQALYLSRLKGMSRADAYASLQRWFRRFEILGWWDKKVETLSKGMAQKVQFIVTVIHRPELLIFDEPFSGFDPINAELLKNTILELKNEGATVLFSTHNMASVEELCDSITLINRSRNVLSGRVDDIRRSFRGSEYDVAFEGNPDALRAAVGALGRVDELSARSARIVLESNDARRELLDALNRAVGVESFVHRMPSMNEIFIQAVEQNNE